MAGMKPLCGCLYSSNLGGSGICVRRPVPGSAVRTATVRQFATVPRRDPCSSRTGALLTLPPFSTGTAGWSPSSGTPVRWARSRHRGGEGAGHLHASSTTSTPPRSRSPAGRCARNPNTAAPGTGSAGTTARRRRDHHLEVVGAYPVRGEISRRLLDALPAVLHLDSGGGGDAVLDHLAAEAALDIPGQQVVLDRLLDWMLVCTLRTWFDSPEGHPPAPGGPPSAIRWWVTPRDCCTPIPLRPWTVSSLAAEAGVSRSTLAKRFTDLVGEPPLSLLTGWRMTLAMDLLIEQETAMVRRSPRGRLHRPLHLQRRLQRVRGINPSEFRRINIA